MHRVEEPRHACACLAGLLGIGGGMIISPLLLEFDMHPHVTAATSTVIVVFSASSAALSFGFAHLLNLQFALTFGLSCFAASLAGVLLVNRIIERSGKARRPAAAAGPKCSCCRSPAPACRNCFVLYGHSMWRRFRYASGPGSHPPSRSVGCSRIMQQAPRGALESPSPQDNGGGWLSTDIKRSSRRPPSLCSCWRWSSAPASP